MRVHSLVVCLFVVASAGLLYGQGGANGTILGTVTDSSGAVRGQCDVDVTNVATGVISPYREQRQRAILPPRTCSRESTGLRCRRPDSRRRWR